MIFGVICVEVSRKFSKNPHFWQKSISTLGRNFEKYFYRGALTPPPKNTLIRTTIKNMYFQKQLGEVGLINSGYFSIDNVNEVWYVRLD